MAKNRRSHPRMIVILQLAFVFIVVISINGFVEAISTAAHFITVPKNKEVFVGDSVQFNWDYKDDKAEIISIKFGISDNDRGRKLINILDKSPKSGIVRFQVQIPLEKRERIESVEDTRASFKIKNVKMNDTGYYFCSLRPDTWEKSEKTSIVFMRVVDLQIDDKQSDEVVESWQNQVISLACSVRVTDDTPVEFTWQHTLTNRTISRGKHVDTTRESILKLITSDDDHFSTYRCIAKTKRTVKSHDVVIRRLYGPGPPENLQAQLTFNKVTGETFQKLQWQKPTRDGGAKVTGYIVEYKPEGIGWDKATRVKAEKEEYHLKNLKEGKKYDVRVRARNKVTEGDHSNEIMIKLDPFQSKKQASSNHSNKPISSHWLYLISIAMVLYFKVQVS